MARGGRRRSPTGRHRGAPVAPPGAGAAPSRRRRAPRAGPSGVPRLPPTLAPITAPTPAAARATVLPRPVGGLVQSAVRGARGVHHRAAAAGVDSSRARARGYGPAATEAARGAGPGGRRSRMAARGAHARRTGRGLVPTNRPGCQRAAGPRGDASHRRASRRRSPPHGRQSARPHAGARVPFPGATAARRDVPASLVSGVPVARARAHGVPRDLSQESRGDGSHARRSQRG